MATSVHVAPVDRRLYAWAAVFIPIIVFIGFARSYYLKALFHTPALPGPLVHLHGIVMTLWVVLFVAQVSLIASHHTRVHQRVGVLGAVLAALIVVVGIATAISASARGAATAGQAGLKFLVVPLGDILVFAIPVAAALYFRRRPEIHKRLMLLGALALLDPAIARIPLGFIERGGPLVFYGLTDVFIIGCAVYDTIKNRRLNPVFGWGIPLIIASQPLRLMLADTDAWIRFASWLVR